MWFQGLIWEVLNVILGFGLSCGTLTKREKRNLCYTIRSNYFVIV